MSIKLGKSSSTEGQASKQPPTLAEGGSTTSCAQRTLYGRLGFTALFQIAWSEPSALGVTLSSYVVSNEPADHMV
jgi:hypothetical protein